MLICSALARPEDDKYTSKFDNINLDEILQSNRLLNNYVNCLLDKGSCTAEGKELKKVLPDALANECAKCNEKQKQGAEKVIRFFITSKPEEWKKLSEVYDPTGEYTKKYNTQIEQVKRGETVTV
uniref:Putative insect pheromone-binding family n=1 Tax=Xenopsylla cheopis TaxID=163159 RepID=A0A6M2DRF8_XENCH